MKKKLHLVLVIILTAITSVMITMYLVDTSETPASYDIHHIDSKILSEQRELIVKLPLNYEENTNKTFPVVYVFGGNTLSYSIAYDTELLMRTGHLEDVIVVGVSNLSQKTRQRDLTPPFMKQDIDEADSQLGKADKYLDFVQKEVIDLIERTYRTSSKRIVVGHSREGLMVMYALISRTELFQGHIALSPALWRENNLFIDHFKEAVAKTDTIETCLFLSMGDKEVDKMKDAFDVMLEFLKTDSVREKIKWRSSYTKGAVHSNNALLSAPIGIEMVLTNK